jgi:cyclopropane-fatty-acyl-phospholipid synthase
MAEHFPNAEIVAVSNSRTQREAILQMAQERGIDQRLTVLTCDINHLELPANSFDRVVSVEMFEHVRNHKELLQRIGSWLRAEGKLFVHIFCHREFAYPFETQGASNWMGRYFFSGGMMPNRDLFARYTDDLKIVQQWEWNGRHYERTSNAWAANMDRNRAAILRLFRECYGVGQEVRWFQRWKMFFLACAELFGAHAGNEWHVSHYLFESVRVDPETKVSGHIPSLPAPTAR